MTATEEFKWFSPLLSFKAFAIHTVNWVKPYWAIYTHDCVRNFVKNTILFSFFDHRISGLHLL